MGKGPSRTVPVSFTGIRIRHPFMYDGLLILLSVRFLPVAERVRRDTDPAKKQYLDGVVYVVGSLLGKQGCANMIACRAGKLVQVRIYRFPLTFNSRVF